MTGLYLVLQQPQVFTRGTLRLLYTVSALCALGGVAVSIFLSLQLSRQMFRPIGRLHDAISQVGQNDLQVQVAIEEDRRDELSELAQQFNRMVALPAPQPAGAAGKSAGAQRRADPDAAGAAEPGTFCATRWTR